MQTLAPGAIFKFGQTWGKLLKRKAFTRGSEIGLIFSGILIGIGAGCAVSGMSWISKALHSLIFGIEMSEWLSASEIENKLIVLCAPIVGGIVLGCVLFILSRRRKARNG